MSRLAGIVVALSLAVGVLFLSGCGSSASSGLEASKQAGPASSLNKVILEVPTIWCSTCKPRVEASARSVAGVKDVQFDRERIQLVVVTYDAAITTPDAIIQAIEEGGDKVARVTKP